MHTANFHDISGNCSPITSQMVSPIPENGPWAGGPTSNDYCAANGAWRGGDSPIMIALDGGPIMLSSVDDGVFFDFRARGVPDLVSWPLTLSTGLLVLDRDGDGLVSNGAELFGNFTRLRDGRRAANGYEALKEFDEDDNGWIDPSDSAFKDLRIWIDRDRNGVCTLDELLPLNEAGILALSVRYSETGRVDRWGKLFRYDAPVVPSQDGRARRSWDVLLSARPQF